MSASSRRTWLDVGGLRIEAPDGTVIEFTSEGMTYTPAVKEGPRTLAQHLLHERFAAIQGDLQQRVRELRHEL